MGWIWLAFWGLLCKLEYKKSYRAWLRLAVLSFNSKKWLSSPRHKTRMAEVEQTLNYLSLKTTGSLALS